MRYAGIIKNDIANAPGVCVSFFVQGCDRNCPHCFNPETWDFNGGKEFTASTMDTILEALTANGIKRDFNLLGGEPLHPKNLLLSFTIVKTIKDYLPDTKIYIWSGYLYEELDKRIREGDELLKKILSLSDYLIDGPFIEEQKDLTLQMRGSRNQRIIDLKTFKVINGFN